MDVFTKRLIEPLIGLIINLPNLDNLGLFGDVDPSSGMQAGSFGAFLGEVINYTIIAFVMFLVIKAYSDVSVVSKVVSILMALSSGRCSRLSSIQFLLFAISQV